MNEQAPAAPKRILLITANESGGAGIACKRLFDALLLAGQDVHLLYFWCDPASVSPRIHSAQKLLEKRLGKWRFRLLNKLNLLYNRTRVGLDKSVFINGPHSLFRLEQLDIVRQADIIHLHWVPKIIHFATFFRQAGKQYVWTLHDMQPFSGGFHYHTGTDLSKYARLFTANEDHKVNCLNGVPLQMISPSEWLAQLASQSKLGSVSCVHTIPNPIDLEVFKPGKAQDACAALGIPYAAGKTYILFVAEHVQDTRKGFKLLVEALTMLKRQEIVLLVIGNVQGLERLPFEVHALGYLRRPEMLAHAYNAADVFVIPSIEDNLPNTVLESLACGTPVVGFRIGGLPDMIISGQTGVLSELGSAQLARAIEEQISSPTLSAQGQICRSFAEQRFSYDVIAQRVIQVYHSF